MGSSGDTGLPGADRGGPCRILFYLKNLNGGGAERAVVDLVNSLDRTTFEPRLLLGRRAGEYLDLVEEDDLLTFRRRAFVDEGEGLASWWARRARKLSRRIGAAIWARLLNRRLNVQVRDDASRRMIQGLVVSDKIHRLREAIRVYRPDVVVSSLMETASLYVHLVRETSLRRGPRYKWVAVEQNNTKQRFEAWYEHSDLAFWHEMTSRVYGSADAVVAVSKGVGSGLVEHYAVDPRKISVIHNHVDNAAVASAKITQRSRPFILGVGRLHFQKNFQALLQAYAGIADRVPEDLVILGEGEDREDLEQAIRRLGLEGRVELPGFTDDVWSYMKAASCLALSSRFEGFPLTLLEAMAAGCPVVSFDCRYGPSEIVTDRIDGILVPQGDISGLSEAIECVVTDKALAARLARKAQETVHAYDRRIATSRYEALFRDLVSA